ncbi:hypothetical protein CHS0354_030040 [Potamilus streckersoni]|uniref:Small acidic protein-like domain-containing protein n=1 Tax=Potamilus streckersoni TaxID=2493646 RepID=A0AAE0WEC0_9BIVA|nr:hypothetical protein CHS0354_030040 [Potamilus streckersoni]
MGDCTQNSLNDVEGSMESKVWKKKKYKCFMKEDSVSSLPVDDVCNKHKKKKHAKDRQTETENHGIYMNLEPDSENMSIRKTLKKKKKRNKFKLEDGQIDQRLVTASSAKMMEQDIDHVSSQNHGAKKKKRKRQMNLDDNRNISIDFTSDKAIMAASDEIVTKKKKKKKKHSENNCTEASLIMETNILEPMSAHTENLSKKEKKKKKKEKNFDKKNEMAKEVNEENIQKKFSSPEKKKKRKRNSNDDVSSSDSTRNGGYSDMTTVPKKKGRIGSVEGGQESNAKDPRHHTQKMDEKNTEDCHKSGRKEKANESNQWVTASLGTEERDKKFLRLLGGFKKGTESSSTSFKPDAKGGSLAMNREQENLYRKEMETVYEKAMSMSLQRGVGLGYEPPPDVGKKIFIDKNKSKSIKFDD